MVDKQKRILKKNLIILVLSVTCALFQSAVALNNRPNSGYQDPIKLDLYYHDAQQIAWLRVQPGKDHPGNLESVYNRYEQINFAYMSGSDFGLIFQDVADENTILQNYEMYAFLGFKEYVRELKGYQEFIRSLQRKIKVDRNFRKQTANIPGFKYSFFLWREKSGFHDFINEEVCRINAQEKRRITIQENFLRSTDAQKLLSELRDESSEYKPVQWVVGHEDRHNKRLHALDQINSGKETWTIKKYSVSDSLELLQKDFEPKLSSLKEFYGNQFQHVLHDEFIDILKKSESIYNSKSINIFDKELTQAVVHFAGVGVEHNTHGYSQKAMGISDFCNSVIEYIDAFELGFQDGIRKKISELSSPVEYVKNLAVGILTMASHLVKVLTERQLQLLLTHSYAEALRLELLDDRAQIAQLMGIAQTYYKNNSGPTMVRQGAAALTDVALDAFLTGKLLNAFINLCKIGVAQRAKTVPFIKELRPQRTASFHPAQRDELLITAEKAAKILVDNKPYSPAAEVVELTSQALIENSCNVQLVIQPRKPTNLAVVPPDPKNSIIPATKVLNGWQPPIKTPMFVDCMDEVEACVGKVTVMPPKTLPAITYTHPTSGALIKPTLDAELVRHLFFPELVTKFRRGKMCEGIGGFHHDYGGSLRKSGKVSYIDITQGPLGTFRAEKLVVDGKTYSPFKTFFPETMDHQAIVDNIWDSLNNGKIELTRSGDLQVNGQGRSGIEIECFVTPQGKITTAYPVIKKTP